MITQMVFDWAGRTPERTAMVYNGTALSYRAFAERIAKARRHFARHGMGGEGIVVLAVGSLLDFWILSLALRSLGLTTIAVPSTASIVPMGPLEVRCVVTPRGESWPGLLEACVSLGVPLLSVAPDDEAPLWFDAAGGEPPQGAHLLCTSGTTGEYKLVSMSPDVDAVMLRRKVDALAMGETTVLCAFDFPAWTGAGYRWAASPWVVGGAVVIEQGTEIHRALLRPGMTHAVLVPGVLARVLMAPAGAFPRNDAMELAVGGGAMTRGQVEAARMRITARVSNWLASTEAGGIALTPLERPDDHRWHRLIPGRVVEVVDDLDRPVPMGETGRVRVLADGGPTAYFRDEAATRAFFRDGHFYPGDLATVRADGRIALQGRLTDVINAGGAKLAPAPVEERLCDLLGVTGVCLFSIQNDGGEEELHVVIEAPAPISRERLAARIGTELLGFHVAQIHFAPTLARNPMGKLLRQEVKARAVGTGRCRRGS